MPEPRIGSVSNRSQADLNPGAADFFPARPMPLLDCSLHPRNEARTSVSNLL